MHACIHSLNHPRILSFIHSLIHSFRWFIHSLFHSFIPSFIRSFVRSFIHSLSGNVPHSVSLIVSFSFIRFHLFIILSFSLSFLHQVSQLFRVIVFASCHQHLHNHLRIHWCTLRHHSFIAFDMPLNFHSHGLCFESSAPARPGTIQGM